MSVESHPDAFSPGSAEAVRPSWVAGSGHVDRPVRSSPLAPGRDGSTGGPAAAPTGRQRPPKLYRIGEVVDYSGVSRQTIHNYATMGLIRESRWTGRRPQVVRRVCLRTAGPHRRDEGRQQVASGYPRSLCASGRRRRRGRLVGGPWPVRFDVAGARMPAGRRVMRCEAQALATGRKHGHGGPGVIGKLREILGLIRSRVASLSGRARWLGRLAGRAAVCGALGLALTAGRGKMVPLDSPAVTPADLDAARRMLADCGIASKVVSGRIMVPAARRAEACEPARPPGPAHARTSSRRWPPWPRRATSGGRPPRTTSDGMPPR